jgi:hypothetical protein
LGGRQPASPSVADMFYLGFYPLAYIAIVLFMRGELRRLTAPSCNTVQLRSHWCSLTVCPATVGGSPRPIDAFPTWSRWEC